MLLFLDQEIDAHADRVEAECRKRGVAYYRFCTERFPQQVRLALRPAEERLTGRLVEGDREVPLEEVTSVWHRRPAAVELDPSIPAGTYAFAHVETQETLDGLYRALYDRRWVSAPHHVDAASHKIHQLRFARQLGFTVPRSLVTNDPDEALRFFAECGGEVIYKPMRFVMITDSSGGEYGIYATLIDRAGLEAHLDSIRLTPCLFQRYVAKSHELRVNVIGDRVWAASIHSQEQEGTRVDFRTDIDACRHEAVHLPVRLERMCLELTHRLGLRMSNIDLIATPDGDYVFLEANPNGQWGWIEDMAGLPLCAALVDELLGVDTLAGHPYLAGRRLAAVPA
jgi:glutathione synthase/RimK-type ligase-like ATP-grasp enzyme